MNRIAAVFLLTSVLSAGSLVDLDYKISSVLEGSNQNPFFDISVEAFALATPILEWGWVLHEGWGNNSSKNDYTAILGLLATYTSVGAMKYIFKRERPQRKYKPRIWNSRITPSFPSGHVASSAVWTSIVSQSFNSSFLWSYVVLSGWSQIYVGNHYFGDVLGGLLVGTIIGDIATKLSKRPINHAPRFSIFLRF